MRSRAVVDDIPDISSSIRAMSPEGVRVSPYGCAGERPCCRGARKRKRRDGNVPCIPCDLNERASESGRGPKRCGKSVGQDRARAGSVALYAYGELHIFGVAGNGTDRRSAPIGRKNVVPYNVRNSRDRAIPKEGRNCWRCARERTIAAVIVNRAA